MKLVVDYGVDKNRLLLIQECAQKVLPTVILCAVTNINTHERKNLPFNVRREEHDVLFSYRNTNRNCSEMKFLSTNLFVRS